MRGVCLALAMLFALLPQTANADDAWQRLAKTLRTDGSYKVRMKAARIITRLAKKRKVSLPEPTLQALQGAALLDEHELVRGMACVALGDLADPRARATLLKAQKDPEPFVRAQAEDALKKLRTVPAAGASDQIFVLSIEADSEDMQGRFRAVFESALKAKASRPIVEATRVGGNGHHLKTIITAKSSVEVGYEVEVRVAIATWPDNNLRHVVTAKARVPVPPAKVSRKLMDKLLSAVAERAAADVLSKIGGSQ